MTRITLSEIGSFRCEVTGMRTDHINLTRPRLTTFVAQASMLPSKDAVFSNNIFIYYKDSQQRKFYLNDQGANGLETVSRRSSSSGSCLSKMSRN